MSVREALKELFDQNKNHHTDDSSSQKSAAQQSVAQRKASSVPNSNDIMASAIILLCKRAGISYQDLVNYSKELELKHSGTSHVEVIQQELKHGDRG